MRLQWMDDRGDSLLALTDQTASPVHEALVCLTGMISIPERLDEIRGYLAGHVCTLEFFEALVLKQVSRMGAELWIRFAHFREWPLPVVHLGNNALPESRRLEIAQQFCGTKPCCRTAPASVVHRWPIVFWVRHRLLRRPRRLPGLTGRIAFSVLVVACLFIDRRPRARSVWWSPIAKCRFHFSGGRGRLRDFVFVDFKRCWPAEATIYRNTEFGGRVGELFDDARPDLMAKDKVWTGGLRSFAKKFKVCNMHVERLLARARITSRNRGGHQSPSVESLRASALLSEVLGSHVRGGGFDPRYVTRRALLARGVPLVARKKLKVSKRVSGYSVFVGKKMRQRASEGVSLASVGGRRAYFGALSSSWAGLPEIDRAPFAEEAANKRRRLKSPVGAQQSDALDAPDEVSRIAISGGFWGLSDQHEPITEQNFVKAIKTHMGTDSLPPAAKYCEHFRAALSKGAVVTDAGHIKAGTKFAQRQPCWKYHPGLCRSEERELYLAICSMAINMTR